MLRLNMIKCDDEAQLNTGGGGDSPFDDFGYMKVDPETVKSPAPAPVEPPPVITPGTGYSEVAPKDEPTPPPVVEESKIDLGYELDTKDLDPKLTLKVKEFAKANGLTKEAAQAFLNLRKTEAEEMKATELKREEETKTQVSSIRKNWDKELRSHSEFGGEQFAANLKIVEKVLSDFMPETKKTLTERGGMLPPYVMRDFAKLGKHLFAGDNFVQGDVTGSNAPPKKETSPLDFYN